MASGAKLSKHVTIWHGKYYMDAKERAAHEREAHPGVFVMVTGEPSHWRVRRDRLPSDGPEASVIRYCQHPDCVADRTNHE